LLTPNDIRVTLDVPTSSARWSSSPVLSGCDGLIDDEVYASLTERERLGSTALGRGVAIPHARAKGLDHPVAAYVRLKNPIPFDAPDGKPVSDIFVLIVPLYAADKHLHLLAQVAEMLRQGVPR
jgi:PTS system nitrogen regulatory IIA component